jgi:IMP dehydrogenase
MSDTWTAEQVFHPRALGYSYDDVILMPGYIDFPVEEVCLKTRLSRRIHLNLPLVSSPMDTITESKMAINMALLGGIGLIHHVQTPQQQAKEVLKVKRFENGFINDPCVLAPDDSISRIDDLRKSMGFSTVPVTETGLLGSKLLGIVSSADIAFVEDRETKVSSVMTTDLITGQMPITLNEANDVIRKMKLTHLPIVNHKRELVSLVCRNDLVKHREYPSASVDREGNLLVGASVSSLDPLAWERCACLTSAGVDIIALDSDQGDNDSQISLIGRIKAAFPDVDVIAGNAVTVRQAKRLIDAGADAIRIGMGVSSVGTANDVIAVGRCSASAVYHVSKFCREYADVPTLSDGGIANSGHIIKALALGASSVILGSLIAGCNETPGDYFYSDGKKVKSYRGSRSIASMNSSLSNGRSVAQGLSAVVLDKGRLSSLIGYVMQGTRHGFQDLGARSITILHHQLTCGELRYVLLIFSPRIFQNGGEIRCRHTRRKRSRSHNVRARRIIEFYQRTVLANAKSSSVHTVENFSAETSHSFKNRPNSNYRISCIMKDRNNDGLVAPLKG